MLASLPPDDEAALRFEGRLAALGQLAPATARPALERLERYEHRLVGETAGERLVLACLAFRAANRGDTAVTTADFARRALADGRLLHDDGLAGPNFLMAVGGLLHSDRLDEADHHLDLALEAARAEGSEEAFAAASALRCEALLRRGQLAQAEAEALGVLAAIGPACGGATDAAGVRAQRDARACPLRRVGGLPRRAPHRRRPLGHGERGIAAAPPRPDAARRR